MFVDIYLLTFMQIYVVINVIKEDKHKFVSHTKCCNEYSALDIWYLVLYVFWYTYVYVFRL